jgi:hypothetical protein
LLISSQAKQKLVLLITPVRRSICASGFNQRTYPSHERLPGGGKKLLGLWVQSGNAITAHAASKAFPPILLLRFTIPSFLNWLPAGSLYQECARISVVFYLFGDPSADRQATPASAGGERADAQYGFGS